MIIESPISLIGFAVISFILGFVIIEHNSANGFSVDMILGVLFILLGIGILVLVMYLRKSSE